MTANDDWLGPVWNQARNVRDDDRLAEDNSTEDVADGSIRGLPHFFETEFFNAGFIRSNGCALNANTVLQNGMSRIDGHLIICGITILNAQVVVLKIYIEIGQDQLLLNELPNNAGHLIAIELDNGSSYLYLRHNFPTFLMFIVRLIQIEITDL